MDKFNIKIQNRIITPSEEIGKILILLDETGEIPSFYLQKNVDINNQIINFLSDFLYQNDLASILSTKQFSYLENNETEVLLCYNFLTHSTASKKGEFVHFNQSSMELFRMANNQTI